MKFLRVTLSALLLSVVFASAANGVVLARTYSYWTSRVQTIGDNPSAGATVVAFAREEAAGNLQQAYLLWGALEILILSVGLFGWRALPLWLVPVPTPRYPSLDNPG